MRKLPRLLAGLSALAFGLSLPMSASAQTTFLSTNDPTASLAVEVLPNGQTAVVVTRAIRDDAMMPVSEGTVLRDASSGISYEMRDRIVQVSKNGKLETTTAVFRPFDKGVTQFDLIDPLLQQRSLYITQIEHVALGALALGQ